MGFNYENTCPKIDKAIDEAKNIIIDYLKEYIMDLCPYIPQDKADDLSKTWGNHVYNEISGAFETVRETNADMRMEADYQIDELESEIERLKSELEKLEKLLDESMSINTE